MSEQPVERRMRQRVMTLREGLAGFWIESGFQRWKVVDLSLDGCGVASDARIGDGHPFSFLLTKEGSHLQLRGEAQAVNSHHATGEGQCGCRFLSFEHDGRDVLWAWLTRYVMDAAAVPLRLKEAEAIVSGPSLV